jgi:hypothetical protein
LRLEAETDFYPEDWKERRSPRFWIARVPDLLYIYDGVDQGQLNIPLGSEFFPSEVHRVGE